jgi:cold shock CspA family protein
MADATDAEAMARLARPPGERRRAVQMHGRVERLSPERGYGFIRSDDGQEYFFHRTALRATRFEDLAPGTAVDFTIGEEEGDRPEEGPRAVSVHLAADALPAVDPPQPNA